MTLTGVRKSVSAVPGENLFINGDFRLWQRGTSITSQISYTADRWFVDVVDSAYTVSVNSTVSVVTDGGITGASVLVPGGDAGYFIFEQRVENMKKYAGQMVTLSFDINKKAAINEGIVRAAIHAEYPIAISLRDSPTYYDIKAVADLGVGSWERLSTTFEVPEDVNDSCFRVGIYLFGAHTTLTTELFRIRNAKLEPGRFSTPYENRPYPIESILCKRYFESSYYTSIGPGTIDGRDMCQFYYGGKPSGQVSTGVQVKYTVPKRTAPTITLYSPTTGLAGYVRDYNSGADVVGYVANQGNKGFFGYTNEYAVGTILNIGFHWAANAEI